MSPPAIKSKSPFINTDKGWVLSISFRSDNPASPGAAQTSREESGPKRNGIPKQTERGIAGIDSLRLIFSAGSALEAAQMFSTGSARQVYTS
jgi:hypothetical protein